MCVKISKYISVYTSIYEKALGDLLARKWLFYLQGGFILSKQIFNLTTSVWIFGENFMDALAGDKEKIAEAVRNSHVGNELLKFPWGILFLVLLGIGDVLLFTLVATFFEAVIFKAFVKGTKSKSSYKDWIIRNGKTVILSFMYKLQLKWQNQYINYLLGLRGRDYFKKVDS